jgi:dolichol-phosphate mannosyltransferase
VTAPASRRALIFVPTYNEITNAPVMCREIHAVGLDADVLFVDDNSPDGTGAALDALTTEYPRLIVHHRQGKLGIGSAHREAIQWAYDQGYTLLVTMDGDFSHSPADIPALIRTAEGGDLAVGSRWINRNSLPGWNLMRRTMTLGGHVLTKWVLGIPQDASGAFRAYRLDRLPPELFQMAKSNSYAFLLESLFIIHRNGFDIRELPIVLPNRVYGNSKMSAAAALRTLSYVFELFAEKVKNPAQFRLKSRGR